MSYIDSAIIGTGIGLILSITIVYIFQYLFGDNRHLEYDKFDLSNWYILEEYGGNEGFVGYMKSDERILSNKRLIVQFEDKTGYRPKSMLITNGSWVGRVGFKRVK